MTRVTTFINTQLWLETGFYNSELSSSTSRSRLTPIPSSLGGFLSLRIVLGACKVKKPQVINTDDVQTGCRHAWQCEILVATTMNTNYRPTMIGVENAVL